MADARERPILFSGPMVRAILAGRKTQTRRVVRHEHASDVDAWALDPASKTWRMGVYGDGGALADMGGVAPYANVGDLLWCRETWRAEEREEDHVDGIRFAADDAFREIASTSDAASRWVDAYDNGKHGHNWRPSIFMPRWACRLVLEVTDVRVQRLQAITEEDAKAEGVTEPEPAHGPWCDPKLGREGHWSYRKAFASLWESINGKRAPWSSNPFVWAISFRRI